MYHWNSFTKENKVKMISSTATESYYYCVHLYNIYVSIPIFMYRPDWWKIKMFNLFIYPLPRNARIPFFNADFPFNL